jgi:hypothetical protein
MFESKTAAMENAQKMANTYHCEWYVISWNSKKFESIGPIDMYYSAMRSATIVAPNRKGGK